MKKILLTSLFVVAGVLVPSQDAMGMTTISNFEVWAGGRSEWYKNTAGYNVTGAVNIYEQSTIVASSPVNISDSGSLWMHPPARFDCRKGLSIDSGRIDAYNNSIDIIVAGTLSLKGAPNFNHSETNGLFTTIKMRKLAEAENEALPATNKMSEQQLQDADDAIIDVSQVNGVIDPFTVNGQSQYGTAFLKYYNTDDTNKVDCIANLSESTYDDKRDDYVTAIRERLTNLLDDENENAGYLQNVTLNNVKIQDYVIEQNFGIEELGDNISIPKTQETILNDGLRNLATEKGLTVVADSRNISTEAAGFDFYTEFSTYNESGKNLVEWPSNTLNLSSSAEDTHDEFVFNTKLAPSESCTHDLSVTNGPKTTLNKLVLSADNTGFAGHKIKLNGDLNTVVYNHYCSYVAIDFTGCEDTGTLSLIFEDGLGQNDITTPCVKKSGQKINLNVGSDNDITFKNDSNSETIVYEFDALTMGERSNIIVDSDVTLII